MSWILVVITMIYHDGISVTHIPFASENACWTARAKIVEQERNKSGLRVVGVCVNNQ